MKFKGTWIFSFVVIFAVGLAIWAYKQQQDKDAAKEAAAHLIEDFKVGEVLKLDFRGGAGSFKIDFVDGDWQITEPIQDRVDFSSMEGLLLGLAEQSMKEVPLEGPANWEQYGLDQPEMTMVIELRDGKSRKIEVGSKRAYNDGYYVRKDGSDKLYLGSTSWTSYLAKTANDLRNKDLYFGSTDNNYLEIHSAKEGRMRFENKEGWVSLEKKDILISAQAIDEFLNLVRHLRADAVVSDVANAAARRLYNINKPALTVTVEDRQPESVKKWKVEFSEAKNNEVFVSVGEDRPVYRIQARKMDSLIKDFSYFRDKTYPFAVDHTRVPAFRIKRDTDPRERSFQKKADGWMILVEEPHMKVNEKAIDNLLNGLTELRVKEFIKGGGKLDDLKGKYGFVIQNALGDPKFEMYWGDEEKVEEEQRVKVWTSVANEVFWMEAANLKSFYARNLLMPDGTGGK